MSGPVFTPVTSPHGFGQISARSNFHGGEEMDVWARGFEVLGQGVRTRAPLQGMVRDVIAPTMHRRFTSLNQSKTDERGPWVPNTKVTQHIRMLQGFPPKPQMNRSLALRGEIGSDKNWEVFDGSATFNLPAKFFYGALLHTGFVISSESMLGKQRRVPRRPWAYFSDAQIELMAQYMANWIGEEAGNVL